MFYVKAVGWNMKGGARENMNQKHESKERYGRR